MLDLPRSIGVALEPGRLRVEGDAHGAVADEVGNNLVGMASRITSGVGLVMQEHRRLVAKAMSGQVDVQQYMIELRRSWRGFTRSG